MHPLPFPFPPLFIGPDDTNWPGVLQNVNINAQLTKYAGPGGWNVRSFFVCAVCCALHYPFF